jgi:hypothetical protein
MWANLDDSRAAHKELAAIAADVVKGLQVRVEADEPLTPEFIELWCVWPRRVYLHEVAAARSRTEREAAAERYWQQGGAPYRLFRSMFDGDHTLEPVAEYAIRECELSLAAAGADPPVKDAAGFSIHSGRPLSIIARDIWNSIQKRIENDEPLTPEFFRFMCDASRRLCVAQLSEAAAGSSDARRATADHARRVAAVLETPKTIDIYVLDGPAHYDDIEYFAAEAKLWAEESGSGQSQRETELRRAMNDAARRHFASLRKRRESDEPLSIEFVEELCDWSDKVCRADEATRGDRDGETTPTAREDHLRRMRDLYADLKKRLDENDADVTRIQVSQAAYFLREAELGGPLKDYD